MPGTRTRGTSDTVAERPAKARKVAEAEPSRSDLFLISDDDIVYEQDIIRDPGSVRYWVAYAEFKQRQGSVLQHAYVLERACTQLPRSYKLWKMYLELRAKHLRTRNSATYRTEYAKVNALYERALILLNKMPRIWEMYLDFLMLQPRITVTRKTFDRALRALPTTQHQRVWTKYKRFASSARGPTELNIRRRYLQIAGDTVEKYIDLLVEAGNYDSAVEKYVEILGNPKFKSQEGKSNYQLWTEMVDLAVSHAREVKLKNLVGLDVDGIIRSGIKRFKDQRGKLWTELATYWIRRGSFDRARDVYEEGLSSVMTVRDFTMIFDSYSEFEESVISALMTKAAKKAGNKEVDEDLDVRMMRFEQLMDRRPFLLNDVLLRQDPNNVAEWGKRVALWGENKQEVVQTYADAIATIEPKKAHGRLHELWTNYAKFYETGKDLDTARVLLDKAVKVPFKSVAELAEMWVEWAELELRNENFDNAMAVMAKATQAPKRSTVDYFDESLSPQQRVHKSWRLWSFYVDLVESVSDLAATRAVYERIFELRIATPQTVVNFANLLEEGGYYEDSYKVYERGLDLFRYPVAFELWNLYLTKAVDRRVGIERLRDLFEQAVDGVPPRFAKPLYLMYGALEEERGLARHAMRIYERATRAVADDARLDMFRFYVTKTTANFGLAATRPIYERAVAALPDAEAATVCLEFAAMETRLGEVDRARLVYGHGAQFCDPRTQPQFWSTWEAFEVRHGNEDTFREMLRIKRSVQAQFNTDVSFIAAQALTRAQQARDGEVPDQAMDELAGGDPMAALERAAQEPLQGFVASTEGPQGGRSVEVQEAPPVPAVANPDALDVDVEDD